MQPKSATASGGTTFSGSMKEACVHRQLPLREQREQLPRQKMTLMRLKPLKRNTTTEFKLSSQQLLPKETCAMKSKMLRIKRSNVMSISSGTSRSTEGLLTLTSSEVFLNRGLKDRVPSVQGQGQVQRSLQEAEGTVEALLQRASERLRWQT